MKGIQSHTHKDREQKIQQLIPEIQAKLGDNLVALGVSGSFARNQDIEYSDLEINAFVKEPLKEKWEIRRIEDGMLIVVVTDTKDEYIKNYLDITAIWYASGADKLLPVLNKKFIEELNAYTPQNITEKCSFQIQKKWPEFQELTAKTFNMVLQKNRDGFPFIFNQMVKELCIILSYLNETAFITLGSYISQVRTFSLKPDGFDELIKIVVDGNYRNLEDVRPIVENVFSGMEQLVESRGIINE